MAVRIRDVAEHAGVSVATVSRVMNGKSENEALISAVRRSIHELGFVPDRQARNLRMQRSDVIALIIPDIENPYYTALARGAEDVTRAAGFSLVMCNSDEQAAKEQEYLKVVLGEKMAGVIIAPSTPEPQIDELLKDKRAVVAVDRAVTIPVDCVTADNFALGLAATEDLLARGHVSIACITGPQSASTAVERAAGWRSAMRSAGRPVRGLLRRVNFRVDGGREAARELLALAAAPDAILATNNLVGVGVLQVLNQREGAEVGCGVIGELPFATSSSPNTTVSPLRPREMGATAARMLLERIEGLTMEPRRIIQPATSPEEMTWS